MHIYLRCWLSSVLVGRHICTYTTLPLKSTKKLLVTFTSWYLCLNVIMYFWWKYRERITATAYSSVLINIYYALLSVVSTCGFHKHLFRCPDFPNGPQQNNFQIKNLHVVAHLPNFCKVELLVLQCFFGFLDTPFILFKEKKVFISKKSKYVLITFYELKSSKCKQPICKTVFKTQVLDFHRPSKTFTL